jgi:hypothetical protein
MIGQSREHLGAAEINTGNETESFRAAIANRRPQIWRDS